MPIYKNAQNDYSRKWLYKKIVNKWIDVLTTDKMTEDYKLNDCR